MFELNGKVAFVTGASSGIGRASAIALAKQGARVVVTARRLDKLEELVSQLKNEGKDALAVKMDVTNKKEIIDAVSFTVKTYGRLDILVNNAGVFEFSPFLETTEETWDHVIDTNLKGYFLVAQVAAREMIKNKWGRIINIGSIAMGQQGVGTPMAISYSVSKGGVAAFTESLADELAPQGVLVNCIAPGLIATEMTDFIMKDPNFLNTTLSKIPLKRSGKPEEISAMVVFLASEEASYVNGATIIVDGGWLAG